MNVNKAMERIHDGYAYTMRELSRLADDVDFKKRLRNLGDHLDFDKRVWLRKVGLQPYSPVKATFGTGMWLLVGAALGALAGLALAPVPGAELRSGVRQRARRLMHRAEYSETQAPAEA
jgi:hypothetical protein